MYREMHRGHNLPNQSIASTSVMEVVEQSGLPQVCLICLLLVHCLLRCWYAPHFPLSQVEGKIVAVREIKESLVDAHSVQNEGRLNMIIPYIILVVPFFCSLSLLTILRYGGEEYQPSRNSVECGQESSRNRSRQITTLSTY